MKLVISSLLFVLIAQASVMAQTNQAPGTPEVVTPAQSQSSAPADGMVRETKHKKTHKTASHHAKKKHHKKKKHHTAN